MKRKQIEQRLGLRGPESRQALAPHDPTISLILAHGTAPVRVDPNTAMTLTAVYAAVNALSSDIAALPIKVYQHKPDGSRRLANEHPAHELLNVSPDGDITAFKFRQALLSHSLRFGRGYSAILQRGDGRPGRLELLDPTTTMAWRDPETRRVSYRIAGLEGLAASSSVLHLSGLTWNGLDGYSPLLLASQSLGLSLAAETYGASYFANGASLGGVIKLERSFASDEDRKAWRADWNSIHQGAHRAHNVGLLEPGMDYIPTQHTPEDAQFLATRQYGVIEVARLFRMPPSKLGDYSQSHLANLEASNRDYVDTVLMPLCVSIEQELNLKLFTAEERRAGYYCKHNMAALLRGDTKSRTEQYRRLREIGVLSVNEIRELEDLDPLPEGEGGDTRIVPLNMGDLSRAGEDEKDETND